MSWSGNPYVSDSFVIIGKTYFLHVWRNRRGVVSVFNEPRTCWQVSSGGAQVNNTTTNDWSPFSRLSLRVLTSCKLPQCRALTANCTWMGWSHRKCYRQHLCFSLRRRARISVVLLGPPVMIDYRLTPQSSLSVQPSLFAVNKFDYLILSLPLHSLHSH